MSDPVLLAFDPSAAWRELPFVSVDVEATGLETGEARVMEVGIVRFERGQVAERWGSLVDPGVPIPEAASQVTGITDEMVSGKPSFRDLKWEIRSRLQDRLFVAYNADYDWGVLQAEFARVGLTMPRVPVIDPLVWARRLMPNERRHALGAVCTKLGIPLDNAHRAEDDAEAAGKVLLRFSDKVAMALGVMLEDQAVWKRAQDEERAARRAEKEARRGDAGPAPAEDEPLPQAGLFG